jgi:hypothetical protein
MKTFIYSVKSFFSQLFSGIFLGGVFVFFGGLFGCIAGSMAAIIGAIAYWGFTIQAYQTLYANRSLFELVFSSFITIGIPVGLLIGMTMGLHFVIFKLYTPHSLIWTVITGLATVIGLWISGFSVDVNNQLGFFFYIAFIGVMTGWFTSRLLYKISIKEFFNYNKAFARPLMIVSSITGFLLTLLFIYRYFNFWLSLRNIHS